MTPCVAITAGSSVVLTFNDPSAILRPEPSYPMSDTTSPFISLSISLSSTLRASIKLKQNHFCTFLRTSHLAHSVIFCTPITDEGWWKGDVDGTVGAFPASYVQIQEVADYGDDDVETPSLASPSELPPSAALSDDVSTLPPTGPPPTGPPPTGPPPTGPPPTRPVDSNAPPSGLPPSAPARSGGNAVAAPAAAIDAQNPAPSNLVRMQMPPPPAMPPPVASSTPPTGNGGSAIRSATGSPTKVMMKSRASKVFSEDSDDESEPYTADLNDRRTLSQMYSAQTEGVMDSSNRPELLWEGPLTKVKSGAFKSKQRFFRLTVETFSYYEENAGVLISKVATKDIASVEDSSGSKFRIILKDGVTMGRENGKSEMLLQASSRNAKAKWLEALGRQPGSSLSPGEALIVAGYLMKMQPFATTTTTRWFEVRDSSFAYYKEEGGKLFFKTHISNIQALQPTSDPTEFKLLSDVPLTKTVTFLSERVLLTIIVTALYVF